MYFSSLVNPLQNCLFPHYAALGKALVAEASLVCHEEPQKRVYNQSTAGREMMGDERLGTTNSEWQIISNPSCSTHLSASCTNSFLPVSKAHSTACCINVKPKSRQKLLTCWPWRKCGKWKWDFVAWLFYPLTPYCGLPCWWKYEGEKKSRNGTCVAWRISTQLVKPS